MAMVFSPATLCRFFAFLDIQNMLLKEVLHLVFAHFVKPLVLRLNANNRSHFTAVGAIGFNYFYVVFKAVTFT